MYMNPKISDTKISQATREAPEPILTNTATHTHLSLLDSTRNFHTSERKRDVPAFTRIIISFLPFFCRDDSLCAPHVGFIAF